MGEGEKAAIVTLHFTSQESVLEFKHSYQKVILVKQMKFLKKIFRDDRYLNSNKKLSLWKKQSVLKKIVFPNMKPFQVY